MPLLISPVDGSPMQEVERHGVKIDICKASGGVWLDKGELEKIIMMVREDALNEAHPRRYQAAKLPQKRKKKNSFSDLFDIFDF